MRFVAIDEQVAVDRAVAEIEPRSIQVFVRTLGPVAHGQRRKQFAVSGIVSAVSQVKFTVVIFHLGSPERPGTVMSVGLRVSGACKSPMHQVRRSITVEPVVLTGRTDQVVNPAMAVDEPGPYPRSNHGPDWYNPAGQQRFHYKKTRNTTRQPTTA